MEFAQYQDSSRVEEDVEDTYREEQNEFHPDESDEINELRKYNPDQPIEEFDEPVAIENVIQNQKNMHQNIKQSPMMSPRLRNQNQHLNQTAAFQKSSPEHATKATPGRQPVKAQLLPQPEPITAERMSDINQKLKVELSQLIERLEMALTKFKERKEKDKQRSTNIGYYGAGAQRSDEMMQKEKELNSAQSRALQVKKEIAKIKRQLDTQYDMQAIIELENDIKNKETVISKLEDQNQQFKKVGNNQQRAMEDLNKQEDIQKKLSQLNTQIRQTKMDIREINEKYKDTDKVIQTQHVHIYDLEERYRKISLLIKKNKNKPQVKPEQDVDEDDLLTEEELIASIQQLEQQKNDEEKQLKKIIYELDKKNQQLKDEKQIEELKLREKEQEVKLVELKIKEIKRQMIMNKPSKEQKVVADIKT